MSQRTRLAELTRKVRAALEDVARMGEQSGDDPEAVSSQRELWTAALRELISVDDEKADDETISAAITRAGRWIEAATEELDADARGQWRRSRDE